MAYPYIMQGTSVTVIVGSTPHVVNKNHISFNKVITAIKAGDWTTVADIVDPKKTVINYGKGNISVKGTQIFWKNRELHGAITTRMVQMINDDFSVEPLINFMENLMENPSNRAVNELYGFLEKNTLPITPDGCFLAYKKVGFDYNDVYSASVPNKVASFFTEEEKATLPLSCGKNEEVTVAIEDDVTVVTMERNAVDDNQHRTCSHGLHFCSFDYLSNFSGERIVVLKINPRDVVSIPSDYNNSKGRTCRYEVIDEVGKDKADAAFDKVVQATAKREASTLSLDQLTAAIQKLLSAADTTTEESDSE